MTPASRCPVWRGVLAEVASGISTAQTANSVEVQAKSMAARPHENELFELAADSRFASSPITFDSAAPMSAAASCSDRPWSSIVPSPPSGGGPELTIALRCTRMSGAWPA